MLKPRPKSAPVKRTQGLKLGAGSIRKDGRGLKESALKVFDIPIGQLVEHAENPNEQSEKTFDQLVERIRTEGFDEPIHVYPEMKKGVLTGKYVIFSGHHRVKAGKLAGMTHVPGIIRDGWDEDRVAIELVTRNQLRGNLNAHKFTELYNRLKKRYEPEQLKKMMGLTEKKAFTALYKQVATQLQPKQRKMLEEAKETINSVDDLSKVLNNIFKEHGNETDHSFMVFTYGGKKHYYIAVEGDTAKKLEALKDRCQAIGPMAANALFNTLLSDTVRIDNVISGISNASQKTPSPDRKPRIRLAPKRK